MRNTNLLLLTLFPILLWMGCNSEGSNAKIYLFDAGTADSPLATHYQTLTEKDTYSPEKGYGWTTAPAKAVFDENAKPMLPLYQDGVEINQTTGFQADLPT